MKVVEDQETGVAYIYLTDRRVYETVQVSPLVNVDLDGNGKAVGVEILTSDYHIAINRTPQAEKPWQIGFAAPDTCCLLSKGETYREAVDGWIERLIGER
ncbi:DUF2283 domain-containing protein [Corynebacterium heidelbergense]|uniref:DUF2283 domain-containing protein n=1 Tax=Corynebacterium heidelbergense TaxID=2055947 RepID=A0A364VE57_9CORY|nr:DUF2283 domain-containing protein [Corynebacterium heidelbergense]RAV34908.1 hypothetical protein CWC39_00795 [Corynebacterium heidelbergense]WCZ36044.1 hypothetical protein CHEID_02390 [Corynebacterium heidelbergense]